MFEQTTAGSLSAGGAEGTAVGLRPPDQTQSGEQQEQEGIGVYRLRSSDSCEVREEQKYMWRRLFRIVDRPERPPIILDCESLGLDATEAIALRFWNDPELWGQRNLILAASANSHWEEFAARCRNQDEDLIVGDNWGILILEEPHVELPALLQTAANLGGWIVTTDPTLCDDTKRIHCSGAMVDASASLFGKRDGEVERRLGVAGRA